MAEEIRGTVLLFRSMLLMTCEYKVVINGKKGSLNSDKGNAEDVHTGAAFCWDFGRWSGVASDRHFCFWNDVFLLVLGPATGMAPKFAWTASYVFWHLWLFPEDSDERYGIVVLGISLFRGTHFQMVGVLLLWGTGWLHGAAGGPAHMPGSLSPCHPMSCCLCLECLRVPVTVFMWMNEANKMVLSLLEGRIETTGNSWGIIGDMK